MVHYLTADDVIDAHRVILRAAGFSVPVLASRARLEGALVRPQHAAHYEDAPFIRQTALLAIAISQAQAFEDGNKRAALTAMSLFLSRNGYRVKGKSLQAAIFLEMCAFLSIVPGYGDEPAEAGLRAFCLWLESPVIRK